MMQIMWLIQLLIGSLKIKMTRFKSHKYSTNIPIQLMGLFLVASFSFFLTAFVAPNKTLLAFTTASGKELRIISTSEMVCIRFGNAVSTIENCQRLNDPNGTMTYAYYMRPAGNSNNGLDLNHVRFNYKGFKYDIYEEYSDSGEKPAFGVIITHLRTGASVDEPAMLSTVKGSLIGIRNADIFPEVPNDF